MTVEDQTGQPASTAAAVADGGADGEPDGTAGEPDGTAVADAEHGPTDPAMQRYLDGLRRPRIIYAGAISVVVAALIAVVAVLWSTSEVAHVTVHSVANGPAPVALAPPATVQRQAWQSADRTAIGTPYWLGTVVTFSAHTVQGRSGLTGTPTWSYSRSDRTTCQVIQNQGTTVAVYRHKGRCDEVTGLDSSTGVRKWTRTLDEDAKPIVTDPVYSVASFTIMLTTPSVIYAFDPGSGLDRWIYAPKKCTIASAALGAVGALINQTCTDPDCNGLKYCGGGPQLVFRDPTNGHSDDAAQKANPDQIKWIALGATAAPISGDQLTSAYEPSTGLLDVYDTNNGKVLSRLPLGESKDPHRSRAIATDKAEVIWLDGVLFAVDFTSRRTLWTVTQTAGGPPTLAALPGQPAGTTALAQSQVVVPVPRGVILLAAATGRTACSSPGEDCVNQTVEVPGAALDKEAYRFGSGFVLAGADTAVSQ